MNKGEAKKEPKRALRHLSNSLDIRQTKEKKKDLSKNLLSSEYIENKSTDNNEMSMGKDGKIEEIVAKVGGF